MTSRTIVLENRYLLVPIGFESDTGKSVSFSFTKTYLGSAWSGGSYSGSLDDAGMCANLEMIDTTGNEHKRLFDGHVAVVGWKYGTVGDPARHRPKNQSKTSSNTAAFPGLLFILARTEDSNKDNVLDGADDLIAYSYALEGQKLTRLSPTGFDVAWMDTDGKQLIIHHREFVRPYRLTTYVSNPRTGEGHYIVERLEP
jgi:hypothetical protein